MTFTTHGIELADRATENLPIFARELPEVAARFTAEMREKRERLHTDAYRDGDVLRWRAHDRAVPVHVLERDYGLEVTPAQRAEYERETAAVLASYKRNQRPHTGEELAEMRAAFGPGAEVVDVLTGRKVTL